MRSITILLAIVYALGANAQTYLVSFAATGAPTPVANVTVENLNSGTSVSLNGDDILRLTITTAIQSAEYGQSSAIRIYPNPVKGTSKLLISAPVAGDAYISVYDITGRQLACLNSYLEKYAQEFILSGLGNGLYIVNVNGSAYKLSGKLIGRGGSTMALRIEKAGDYVAGGQKILKEITKGVQGTVDMEYTAGDMLLFTGSSGDYSTIVTDIPAGDKTVTFNFIACTDGDGNNYPVVEIGTGTKGPQVWMARNLKTTKYSGGSDIPLITDGTAWSELGSPGFCWYDNDEASYKSVYGALYNWYAVGTGNLCPVGWHVPDEAEWTSLSTYLGGNAVAGGKLKEVGIAHWANPNKKATNETGFTAVGGGYRTHGGEFTQMFFYSYWWTATELTNVLNAIPVFIIYNFPNFFIGGNLKRYGFSVRCVKD